MKIRKVILWAALILVGGCVPSLHQLYTDDVLVYEEKLTGKWSNDTTWEFTKAADQKAYDLTILEKEGKKGKFTAHLVRLNKMQVLDVFPVDPCVELSDWVKMHLIGAHTFIKVEQIGSKLTLWAMNPDTLKKMLEKEPRLIKHEVVEDRVILTAAPKQLQQFLKKHADAQEFFGDPYELERFVPKDSNAPADTAVEDKKPETAVPAEKTAN